MKKILYLDIIGGIAGDMLVGGLLDLGVPLSTLDQSIRTLNIAGLSINSQKEQRHHIAGTRFLVENKATQSVPRSYKDIKLLIETSSLPEQVKNYSLKIFEKLAMAESQIHDVPPDNIHFHEVGAWDSIADVLSISICLDYLGIDAIYVSTVPTGTGFVSTAHGKMPIPAPATLMLLKGFEVLHDSLLFERTTPTGAAVIAALAQPQPTNFQYTLKNIGVGIGTKKHPEVPNIIRCVLGETNDRQTQSNHDVEIIECSEANIDDCSPEFLGYVHDLLLEKEALDVWFVPIHMKKNRPGILLQVLYYSEKRSDIHRLIFKETTTLGIRYQSWNRIALERTSVEVPTAWGKIRGKKSIFDEQIRFSPEFEDCKKIASEQKIPLQTIYRVVSENFWQNQNTIK